MNSTIEEHVAELRAQHVRIQQKLDAMQALTQQANATLYHAELYDMHHTPIELAILALCSI